MADYTTTALLTSINNRALVPTSQTTFQNTDILALANEELQLGVVPFIMKHRSDYFTTTTDTSVVANQQIYPIPSRAVGQKIEYLSLVDTNGNLYDIPLIEREEAIWFNQTTNWTARDFRFYFQGNSIFLIPQPTVNPDYSLRFAYFNRPNQLVATSSAGQITAINSGTNQITVTATPSTWAVGNTCDLINGTPGFENRAQDLTISAISGNIITFSSALPSTLAVNDWVSLSQTSPIPQIPWELHPMLAQRTAIKLLEAIGDAQALQTAQAKLKEMEDNAEHLISPRSDLNPKKLINRFSTLRSWGYRGYARY